MALRPGAGKEAPSGRLFAFAIWSGIGQQSLKWAIASPRRRPRRLLLWLRLLALVVRGLGGARGAELIEPRLKERGPRLGQAQGAIAKEALLDILPAGVVALTGEGGLIAHEIGRHRTVRGAGLDRLQNLGHRLFGLGAFLDDCVAGERGAVGAPEPAGTGLAIGGLEHARGDLRGHERRAVQDIEGYRAGRDVGLESLQAVGTSDVCRFDRLFADDIDDAALRGIGNAFPGKLQLVDRHHLVVAGNLQEPRLAIEEQRAPDEARHARRGRRLCALGARPRALRRRAGGFGFGGRGRRSLRRGGGGAREHQLRMGRARREKRADEAAKQGAKASTHRLSVEALGKKGKAFGCPEQRAQGLKIRRLRALRRQIAPPIYAPTGRSGLENEARRPNSGVEKRGSEELGRRLLSARRNASRWPGRFGAWRSREGTGESYGEGYWHRLRHNQL